MPIGPITPGSPVTVTPDASPAAYASIQAPTATMGVVAADLQALTLALLNVQQRMIDRYLDRISGGTISGPIAVTSTVDFQAAIGSRPTFQHGLRVVADGLVISAGDLSLSNGSVLIANDLTVGDDALIAGDLTVGAKTTIPMGGRIDLLGSVTWRPAITITDGVHSVGKVSGSAIAPDGADTIIVPPGVLSADRDFTVRSAGAQAGNRMRFYSDDNAHYLYLKQDDASPIVLLKSGSVAPAFGFWKWLLLEHNGSANGWYIIGGQAG